MVKETAGNTGSGKNLSGLDVFEILTSTLSSESRKIALLQTRRAEVHLVPAAAHEGPKISKHRVEASPKFSAVPCTDNSDHFTNDMALSNLESGDTEVR